MGREHTRAVQRRFGAAGSWCWRGSSPEALEIHQDQQTPGKHSQDFCRNLGPSPLFSIELILLDGRDSGSYFPRPSNCCLSFWFSVFCIVTWNTMNDFCFVCKILSDMLRNREPTNRRINLEILQCCMSSHHIRLKKKKKNLGSFLVFSCNGYLFVRLGNKQNRPEEVQS